MTKIHNLGMTDTEYAQLAAQGYDPNLEHQLVELGESLDQVRKLARVVGLTQDKPLQTEEEWQEFMAVSISLVRVIGCSALALGTLKAEAASNAYPHIPQ
jgi:hypothetical protein